MSKDRVVEFKTPVQEEDPLTELLRMGSQKLIAGAVEAEFAELLSQYAGRVDGQGRRAVVRNGYLPEREIQTGIGPVKVRVPKARDRSGSGVKFNSRLLPPYLRRTKQIAELLPWLYLKGVSTGDFREALAALLGADAKGALSRDDQPSEGPLARGACRVAPARPLPGALRVFLGRWGVLQHPGR